MNFVSVFCVFFFFQLWRNHFSYVQLRRHHAFAVCDTCALLRLCFMSTSDKSFRNILSVLQKKHYSFIHIERGLYHEHREEARQHPDRVMSIIVDGADQNAYGLPHFEQKNKTLDGGRTQRSSLVGVLVHGIRCFVYQYQDIWGHDANIIIEALQRSLKHVEKQRDLPDMLYLQMDNAANTNKNKYMLGWLALLVKRHVFNEIMLCFLPVGHTHEDIDQVNKNTYNQGIITMCIIYIHIFALSHVSYICCMILFYMFLLCFSYSLVSRLPCVTLMPRPVISYWM